jgi:molybdenum cofactor cytidylyltransferase
MSCKIGAIVLAAGLSTRMGRPKMLLPWGETTVLGQVVCTLYNAGVAPVLVVTGAFQADVEATLQALLCPTIRVHNPHFEDGEMLHSLITGVNNLPGDLDAVLVALGDQPQIEIDVVKHILERFAQRRSRIIVPSYQMRRGHPWLVERSLWGEIASLTLPRTLRDFLSAHQEEIDYLVVNTSSVIQDLDTPEDYERLRPKFQGS